MPDVRVHRFAELSPGDLVCWDQWQRAEPELASPCFRPEFFAIADQVQGQVEVAVLREGERPLAFFPFQRTKWGVAEPVVSGMNDFHGLIAPRGTHVDLVGMLRASRLIAADFQSVPSSQRQLVQPCWIEQASHYLDLSQGFECYCQERKAAGSHTVEKALRKARRFAREEHARFELRAPADMLLRTLIQWKNQQHAELGVLTPIQSPTSLPLLRQFLQADSDRFEAFLSVLWGNDLPAAIAYVLRSGPTAHCWFVGYDEQFAKASPGLILILEIAAALAAEGVTQLHLGKGDERFKTSLANGQVLVAEGMLGDRSLAMSCLRGWRATKQWVKRSPLAVGVRLLRPFRKWWTYGAAKASP